MLRTSIPEIVLVCQSAERLQLHKTSGLLPVLLVTSSAYSAICMQNIEAMTALSKHLVALINHISFVNCMAEREMKATSTYFVMKLVTYRLICRFFSQQYKVQLCKGCRPFRISSYYLFVIFINLLRWCQTYFLLKIKVNNLFQ